MSTAYKYVSKNEFDAFLAHYPRPLEPDVKRFCEPAAEAWHDWTLGDAFQSVVAMEYLYQECGCSQANTYRILA